MSNILNHNREIFNFNINRQDYWDFHISLKQGSNFMFDGLTERCLSTYIDTNDPNCVWFDEIISKEKYVWDDAINNGVELENIGYTGVDNGLIDYEQDKISNEEFLRIFLNSRLKIKEDDLRLKLKTVKSNNQIYDYDTYITDDDGIQVIKLDGGFYQGFFNLFKNEYKVLPTNLGNGWNIEVTLKKEDFDTNNFTLNNVHPENKGMFFYIGTRAENKWWKYYTVDTVFDKSCNNYVDSEYSNEYIEKDSLNDSYFKSINTRLYEMYEYFKKDDYLTEKRECCGSISEEYEKDNVQPSKNEQIHTLPEYINTYNENTLWKTKSGGIWMENEQDTTNMSDTYISSFKGNDKDCNCNEYFNDNYVKGEYFTDACDFCGNYVEDGYIKKEVHIDADMELLTSEGYNIKQPNAYEIETDNKFILFNHTDDGFTIKNWNDDNKVVLYDIKKPDLGNYFTLFNHTKDGYTTKTIDKLIENKNKQYDVLADLYRNAIGFQITDDGEIGYKYMIKDCETDNGNYKIESEYSAKGIIHNKIWYTVSIKIIPLSNRNFNEKCDISTSSSDKMKIYIYVNGKLILVSKELPMFNFRELNDLATKQEAVAYNLSLGGGTQGLCDVIYPNFRQLPQYILPLEKEFGGSFIGYINRFRFYTCPLNLMEIVNNHEFDEQLLKNK